VDDVNHSSAEERCAESGLLDPVSWITAPTPSSGVKDAKTGHKGRSHNSLPVGTYVTEFCA